MTHSTNRVLMMPSGPLAKAPHQRLRKSNSVAMANIGKKIAPTVAYINCTVSNGVTT